MMDLNQAQTLIARLVAIGMASAIFTYFLIKLLAKPFLQVRLAESKYLDLAINGATAAVAVFVSIALQVITGFFVPAAAPLLEAVLTAIIAASVATYGYEAVKNYRYSNVTNSTVGGDQISIGTITSSSVAVGEESSTNHQD